LLRAEQGYADIKSNYQVPKLIAVKYVALDSTRVTGVVGKLLQRKERKLVFMDLSNISRKIEKEKGKRLFHHVN
jgi:hypothetical protein